MTRTREQLYLRELWLFLVRTNPVTVAAQASDVDRTLQAVAEFETWLERYREALEKRRGQ